MRTITQEVRRQFVLGQQGLFPGRRWQGKAGVQQALLAGSVVQIDPLNVLARSHDITLFSRVLDYRPELLDTLLYTDRAAFDWGGTVFIYPMHELPYLRVVMARKREEPRRKTFAEENDAIIRMVRNLIHEQGPVSSREIASGPSRKGTYRSGKISGLALYYLWLSGELMTHSRRGFERRYDLLERVAPPEFQHTASPSEADDYFARGVLRSTGMATAKSWRAWFAGTIERPVSPEEAAQRMDALSAQNIITAVKLDANAPSPDAGTVFYVPSEQATLLDVLMDGKTPAEWQPIEHNTSQEVTFLAPLEIVSARGRAMKLFGFEYLWEVYKPAEKRRWGYYTLPILYGDRLVARFDARADRASKTLVVKNFWFEADFEPDDNFLKACAAGLRRFTQLTGAGSVVIEPAAPAAIRDAIRALEV